MKSDAKIYIAGHRGLVGSALIRRLEQQGYHNLITRTHEELDLTNSLAVAELFKQESPEYIFLAAAKVGGIYANSTYPAEFIHTNLQIQNNVIHHAYSYGVKKLMFLGSSCMFPKHCPQPIKEEYLLTGPLEETNEPYAVAKIAGLKMCQSYNKQYGTQFIVAIPTNLYGIQDNFHPENSHVIPALIQRFHQAQQNNDSVITIWGTGSPQREFLYVDDLAAGCIFLMEKDHQISPINVGCGTTVSIKELVQMIQEIVDYKGQAVFDSSKPDGMPMKSLDGTKMEQLGWSPSVALKDGLNQTYQWYRSQVTAL